MRKLYSSCPVHCSYLTGRQNFPIIKLYIVFRCSTSFFCHYLCSCW